MQEKGPESNLIMPSGAPGGFRWDVPRHRELLCVVLAIAAADPGSRRDEKLSISLLFIQARGFSAL